LPLVYHGDDHRLRCHTCGYSQAAFASCPSCGNVDLAFHTFGTKAIVDEVHRLFPEARIQRFDTDNVKSERLEKQYSSLAKGDVDVIVGTQMIAKGLDLPRLSTLGIVLADASLYLPDYTAQERTYELLSQVIGRVGRGHVDGHVIVQTYNPTSPLLKAALEDDWSEFYNNEIIERRRYFFPPFSYLLKLTIARKASIAAEHAAQELQQILTAQYGTVIVDGPAPAFREKVAGSFVWQLVVRSRQRAALLEIIARLPNGWSYDIDPADLM
jgi:primosomal protein N' (replication factor Y)